MPIDVSTLVDYSWSDIAKAAKTAMMKAALSGKSVQLALGTRTERISIDDARTLYELATEQALIEASGGDGGTALVRYGERV